MIRNREILFGATIFGVVAAVSLTATQGNAQGSCADMLADVKAEREDPGFGEGQAGLEMPETDKHIVAAEVALQGGDEGNCVQEVTQAREWLKMESRKHRLKGQ